MIVFDDALGVPEDGLGAVHHGIRRQSALGGAQGHRAARGLEAESHLVRGGNFVVQSCAVWVVYLSAADNSDRSKTG
jgi:hypothetical protein